MKQRDVSSDAMNMSDPVTMFVKIWFTMATLPMKLGSQIMKDELERLHPTD